MIYLALAAAVFTIAGFVYRVRSVGFSSALLDALASLGLGWLAGLSIGVGARFGMWAIPFFNGTESRFTGDGTLQVILVFSLFGIGLGVLYELVFRRLLANHGLLFGSLVTVVAAYPLGEAAMQQITFTPSVLPAIAFTLVFVAIMFVPFGIALELLLASYHSFRDSRLYSVRG